MKKFLVAALLVMSCATVGPRPMNPDGSPAPYPEEMTLGVQICQQMCFNSNREFERYQADGKCVCKGNPRTSLPRQLKDGRISSTDI